MAAKDERGGTLEQRIQSRMEKIGGGVFLTREFDGLGAMPSVRRTLSRMVDKGLLVRLGNGVFAAAEPGVMDGLPTCAVGEDVAIRVALTKLGIEWQESRAVRDYNAGRSTQIPANPVFEVRGKLPTVKLTVYGRLVCFEVVQDGRPRKDVRKRTT